MPKDGYESITLPKDLVEQLDKLRYENTSGNQPQYSYADVIRRLLQRPRTRDSTGRYDGSTGVEVVRMDNDVISDIAGETASAVRRELDPSLF